MSKKLFLTKRSLFLFLTLTFVGLIGVFKGPIFHFALRTYVSYKIPMEGAWGFDYSYISLSDQGIAFHDIQLCCEEKDASIMIGKVICQAPAIENISFSNHYIIEDLDIKFAKKFSSQKQKNPLNLKSLIGSLKNLEITNGTISIPGESLDFSLGKSVSPQKAGEIVFSKKNQGQVRCVLSSWADRFIIDLEAKRSFLPFYKKFADFFMSEKTGYWEVEKGRMDGRAFLAISDTSIKDMRVHMNLMDAKFSNENLGMVSSFDRVFVDLHYPTSSEEKGFIENIKINSSVDKGELAVFHENGGHRFCLKDISGFVSVSSFKEAAVEISGFVDDQERLLPVKLVGKPAHVNRSGLELDLDLQLDPLFGEKASVNVVCLHQDGDFTLTSRLDSLKVNQMLILQVGLGLLNPEFRDYTIHNGTYSGDIHVVFNQHGLKDFSLRDLSCKNLGIYSGKHDIRVEADSVSGECGIDLFEKKKTILSDWQMEMKNGKCIIGQEEKEPLYLTDIDMDVTLKKGRFVESKVSGQGRGISANIEIEGSGEAPQLEIKAKSKGTDFLKCFVNGPKEYDNQVLLSCHIEKEGEDYVSSGILSVLDTDLVNDLNFEIKGNKIADLEYRFSSDEISGRLYPFMNEVFKFNWSVEGTYGVKGSYKNQKLSCDFSGKGATYREVHSFIKEAEGTAKFVKDFADNTYVVDVHLTKGHKKVIAGKRMDLQNAHLRISSDESYFKVRDFLGKVDFDEVGLNLLVRGNRFDIFENGTCLFDMQLEKENLEIMRLIGNFEDQKISLGSLSHFLDAPVYLKLCDFSSSFNLMLESDINFDEVPFPKIVRDQKIGKRAALISVNDFNYKVFLDNDFFVLKGDSEGFEVNMQDMALKGRIDEGVLSLEGTEFSYQGYNILMNSAEINHHEAVFNGKVKNDDFEYSGLVLWNLLQGQHFEGRGKGKYTKGD